MKTPETNGWQRDEDNKSWLISVVIAATFVIIFYRFMRLSPALLLLTFIVLTLIVYQFIGFRPRKLIKFFPTTFSQAENLIMGMLDEKGLPYDVSHGRYYLIGSNLRLEVENYRHKGLEGILVRFVPYDGTNMPMIISLSQRLDEAFAVKDV